ncbi:aminotransferase class I/II-fold pyridoxal phosphate-dependent enzyme [Ornithinimicrobium cerasi]|uniref:aminotransferase class I/II-fold pyridoxal phosphate-dependent enzyme n=1 Tax=Ornithinimicrobium cerasi TaxID=2248773 RepID=UPI000EFED715|nr:aminotransferase class I/II-fold pyridoxal phosphate-dependent enzyme [Ornithinimicrobium cerasi]
MRAVPPAGTHGGDGVAVARSLGLDPADLLDLSQNMNPVAPDVGPLVGRHLDALGRYPDAREATALLATTLGVDADRVLLTNGGSEAIHLVARVLGGRVRSEPEFGLHPRGSSGPVWRSDPHSPTGRLAGRGEVADVWDEAFHALATGRWSAGREDVVVVGSLTKTFACPGLRLGYVLAAPDVVRRCAGVQPHWSVSTLALAVLPDLLRGADLPRWSSEVARLRVHLVTLLEDRGLRTEAADAPWVLVHEPGLRERLAPHGVLVRDCASFGLPGVARVAVPDEAGLHRLATALTRMDADG